MTYEQFCKLTVEKKAEIVWDEGRFLTEKKYINRYVELYAISNFFVEIWFSIPHNIRDFDFLLFIRSFKKIGAIEPYLLDEESFNQMKMV